MHWPELRPQTHVSGLRMKLTNAMRVVTQVALTGMRVVTQDFGRKSKLNSRVHCTCSCNFPTKLPDTVRTCYPHNMRPAQYVRILCAHGQLSNKPKARAENRQTLLFCYISVTVWIQTLWRKPDDIGPIPVRTFTRLDGQHSNLVFASRLPYLWQPTELHSINNSTWQGTF
jgi:hypothetical protein